MSRRTRLDNYSLRPRWIRYILGYMARILGTLLARVRVVGRRNIPRKGPFIIAANHFSRIDPFFVIYTFREPISFLMASDEKVDWYLFWAPWLYGFIPTNRKAVAPSTVRRALGVLRRKEILGIFPEGTATEDHLRLAKKGAVYLSTLAQAPILPVSVYGLRDLRRDWIRGRRPRITVKIGKPFTPSPVHREKDGRKKALQEIGEDVMCRIAALLPEEAHGQFTGDSRIKDYHLKNR